MGRLGGHELLRQAARGRCSLIAAALLALAGWGPVFAAPSRGPSLPTSTGLDALVRACTTARQAAELPRLRAIQALLLQARPAPQPLAVVLANAEALLRCGAPDGALVVLNRYSPAPGPETVPWTLLQWRAAAAALDHRLAAQALNRLVAAAGLSLEGLQVPVAEDDKGRWRTMAALDLLVGHLDALGQRDEAVALLLASRTPGVETAQRWSQAVSWSGSSPLASRLGWLDRALDQAAAAGAWGLAASLLDQQLELLRDQPAALRRRVEERRRRLSRRIDDEASLRPKAVRSPRDPGGHAAIPDPVPSQP